MRIEGMKRIDIPEINKEAFREAIINAFCHRDYWNPDSVHLAIFKDRVEIRSPGLLIGDLTVEKIRKEKVSERRNELIVDMFHLIRFVENWGKGIEKILKLESKTEFKELGRKFYSVFKRKAVQEKEGEKVTIKVTERVTGNQRKIIEFISINKFVTVRELSLKVGISERKIKENISKLKKKGFLKRIGPAKGGHWEIIEKTK